MPPTLRIVRNYNFDFTYIVRLECLPSYSWHVTLYTTLLVFGNESLPCNSDCASIRCGNTARWMSPMEFLRMFYGIQLAYRAARSHGAAHGIASHPECKRAVRAWLDETYSWSEIADPSTTRVLTEWRRSHRDDDARLAWSMPGKNIPP